MSASEARSELVMDILSKNMTEFELHSRVDSLEKQYGENAFTSYTFSKKSKPWTKSDYEQLKKAAMTGAGSKDFLLYLYEVKKNVEKNDIHGIKHISDRSVNMVKKHPLATSLIIIIVVVVIISLLGWKE